MMQPLKLALAAALLAGVATVPAPSQAESAKSQGASAAKQKQAANDEFEENRRAHTQKSKENNANKSAN